MTTLLLIAHFFIAASLVGIILMQQSEGGALGGLGGGSMGGLMSARGTANLLTRATAGLAVVFMLTSLGLGILYRTGTEKKSFVDEPTATETINDDGPTFKEGLIEDGPSED